MPAGSNAAQLPVADALAAATQLQMRLDQSLKTVAVKLVHRFGAIQTHIHQIKSTSAALQLWAVAVVIVIIVAFASGIVQLLPGQITR